MGVDSLDAALRSFKVAFAFRNGGLYAGSEDLYHALETHMPDTIQYFLEDSWKKVSLYDSKILSATARPDGTGQYRITLKLDARKVYFDSAGRESPAVNMNDYMDIGAMDSGGSVIYIHRYQLRYGVQTLEFIVKGRPISVQIDPYGYLLSRTPPAPYPL
jgi:hypothetical protein